MLIKTGYPNLLHGCDFLQLDELLMSFKHLKVHQIRTAPHIAFSTLSSSVLGNVMQHHPSYLQLQSKLKKTRFLSFRSKNAQTFEKPTNLFLFASSFQNDFSNHSTQSKETDSAGFMGEQRHFNSKLKSFFVMFKLPSCQQ